MDWTSQLTEQARLAAEREAHAEEERQAAIRRELEEAAAEFAGTWGSASATELAHQKAIAAFGLAYEAGEHMEAVKSELVSLTEQARLLHAEVSPVAMELRQARHQMARREAERKESAARRKRAQERAMPRARSDA